MSDVESYTPPDSHAPHRFDNIKRLIRHYKGDRAIIMMTRNVWGNPRDLLGYVQLFINCIDDPGMVEALVEKVVEAVKNCFREGGPGGGYVCSSSHVIHEGVKPELYKVMLGAIREYGHYPLDMDRLAPDPDAVVPNPSKKD